MISDIMPRQAFLCSIFCFENTLKAIQCSQSALLTVMWKKLFHFAKISELISLVRKDSYVVQQEVPHDLLLPLEICINGYRMVGL